MKLNQMLFNDDNEMPLENAVVNGGYTAIFRKIAVIGDSLSSGEFESLDEHGSRGYHDYFEHSWGQYLARMCGSVCYNFSRGGMSAKEYCEGFADNMRFWDAQYASPCYIIALGANDIIGQNQEVGSLDDINEDYTKNAKSFIGYYAQIIARYKKIQPRAKFFLMTLPKSDDKERNERIIKARKAILDLVSYFDNTYALDLYEYAPVYDESFRKKLYMLGHLNPMGYVFTAHMVASYIDYIIRHNLDDFKEVGFIGTDLTSRQI